MKKGAIISDCEKYRYSLWRIWDKGKDAVLFIGLNPSTADESEDDNTLRRCIGFAKSWGYGGVYMVNLFAYRTPHPSKLKNTDNPIGPENDKHLKRLAKDLPLVVAAWGNNGRYMNRGKEVIRLITDLHCLDITLAGEPKHPLYVSADATPKKYRT